MDDPKQPPSNPGERYESTEAHPWNLQRSGHLLRRGAFGPSDETLDAALTGGLEKTVDRLLDFNPTEDPFGDLREQMLGLVNVNNPRAAQEWWLYRMVHTPHPLHERMTLFWHDHFATSLAKVRRVDLMHRHVETLRKHATGNFRDLLLAMTSDPAMLIWLDGKDNNKDSPNENYAREIMELFALGVGQYTEDDIREMARCFTGWRIEGQRGVFRDNLHDKGEKTVFGKTGKFGTQEAVDLILKRPQAPKFIAKNLLRDFVHPEPTDELVDHFGGRVRHHNWEIAPVVREILMSRAFNSAWAYRSRIKSPVELVLGATNALGGKPNMRFIREMLPKLGQEVMYPPDVSGWSGGEAWINANTVLVRFNFGLSVSNQRGNEFAVRSDLLDDLRDGKVAGYEGLVRHFARVLLDDNIADKMRQRFVGYVSEPKDKNAEGKQPFKLNRQLVEEKAKGLVHLMMAMPEYQLA